MTTPEPRVRATLVPVPNEDTGLVDWHWRQWTCPACRHRSAFWNLDYDDRALSARKMCDGLEAITGAVRMLEPHEIAAGMSFPADYLWAGTKRDRVRMAGNAVTPPAARDLVAAVAESLGGAA